MKEAVAIINSVMDYGSTGSLARQLYEYGKLNEYEPYVFYGRGNTYNDDNIIRIDSKLELYAHKGLTLLTGMQGSFSNYATSKLIKVFDRHNIQKVIFLNLHGYYLNEYVLFDYCRNKNVSIVYVMPDEYAGLGKCTYCFDCTKFRTYCEKCPQVRAYPRSLFLDTSSRIFNRKLTEYQGQRIIFAGPRSNIDHLKGAKLLEGKNVKELDWGIDLNLYKFELNEELYEKYCIPRDKILILTVAAYTDKRKGVKEFFFGTAKDFCKNGIRDFHFINVGYDGKLSSDEMPRNMTVIPYMNNQKELAQLYSMCDLYVLASTSDTQPISALIAFGCGTPVCCFYVSGLKYISNGDKDIVRYVESVTLESMIATIKCTKKKLKEIKDKCRSYAEERYSKDIFNQKVYGWLIDCEKKDFDEGN